MNDVIPSDLTEEDIAYFKEKLANTKDLAGRERLQKQIDLLEDAVVIYREHRLKDKSND